MTISSSAAAGRSRLPIARRRRARTMTLAPRQYCSSAATSKFLLRDKNRASSMALIRTRDKHSGRQPWAPVRRWAALNGESARTPSTCSFPTPTSVRFSTKSRLPPARRPPRLRMPHRASRACLHWIPSRAKLSGTRPLPLRLATTRATARKTIRRALACALNPRRRG